MTLLKNLIQVVKNPDQVLAEKAKDGDWIGGLIPVILTSLVLVIFPVLNNWASPVKMLGNIMLVVLLISMTYLLSCFVFWGVGRVFHTKRTYRQIFATWGYSYYSTLVFGLFLVISHVLVPEGVPLFGAGAFFSLFVITLMLFLGVWKIMMYIAELRVVLQMTVLQILLASILIVIFFVLFWSLVGYVFGMKLPIV